MTFITLYDSSQLPKKAVFRLKAARIAKVVPSAAAGIGRRFLKQNFNKWQEVVLHRGTQPQTIQAELPILNQHMSTASAKKPEKKHLEKSQRPGALANFQHWPGPGGQGCSISENSNASKEVLYPSKKNSNRVMLIGQQKCVKLHLAWRQPRKDCRSPIRFISTGTCSAIQQAVSTPVNLRTLKPCRWFPSKEDIAATTTEAK